MKMESPLSILRRPLDILDPADINAAWAKLFSIFMKKNGQF